MAKVISVITKDDNVLVGKLKLDKIADFSGLKYVFPGGTVENNETPETAVIRESLEETGLTVEIVSKIGDRIHPLTNQEIIYFHCIPISGELSASDPNNDDLESLEWCPISELGTKMENIFDKIPAYLKNL